MDVLSNASMVSGEGFSGGDLAASSRSARSAGPSGDLTKPEISGFQAAAHRFARWLARHRNGVHFSAGLIALLALFALYAHQRQRWVGACDWYGYYEEARLLTQGRLTMPSELDVRKYPALAPLGFIPLGGRIVPQYPPGFPLLLAAGMIFGVEYFVPALCGVLFVLVMYLTLLRRVSRPTAWLFAAAWAFFPIVMLGALNVMSDLPAALAVLACFHLLVDRDRPVEAGLIFAFALAIRPTNVLFGVLLLPMFGSWRRFVRFVGAAAVLGGVYGVYNWQVFGAPWRSGYVGINPRPSPAVFLDHFAFYGNEVLARFTPLLLLPALWGVVVRRARGLFLLAWFLVFWILYSFWAAGGDLWWYMRFLLPGLAPLFLLAVEGLEDLRLRLERALPRWRLAAWAGLILVGCTSLAHSLAFAREQAFFEPNLAGKWFYDFAVGAKKKLPVGALAGSWEASGALRLYGGIESFVVLNPEAPTLIADTVKAGRPLYILLEPSIREDPVVLNTLARFELEDEGPIQGFKEVKVLRVLGPHRAP